MVGLIDISPVVNTVPVGEQEVEVYGVSIAGIAALFIRFPDIRRIMAGKVDDLDPWSLAQEFGPDVIAAVIAAGTGAPGSREAEEVAAGLGTETQIAFLDMIYHLTVPGGLKPFLKRLEGYVTVLGEGPPAKAARGARGRSGKKRASKSRKPSKV